MKALLAFLWCGCWHKWKIINQVRYRQPSPFRGPDATGNVYTLQCERCGNIKAIDA